VCLYLRQSWHVVYAHTCVSKLMSMQTHARLQILMHLQTLAPPHCHPPARDPSPLSSTCTAPPPTLLSIAVVCALLAVVVAATVLVLCG